MFNPTQFIQAANTTLGDFNNQNSQSGHEIHPGLAAEAVAIYVSGIALLALIAITCGYRDKIKECCVSHLFGRQSGNTTPVPEIVVSSADSAQRTEGETERTSLVRSVA